MSFPPELFRFLKDLAAHNDRAWFNANKERYETAVKGPLLAFINVSIVTLNGLGVATSPLAVFAVALGIGANTRTSRRARVWDCSPRCRNSGRSRASRCA